MRFFYYISDLDKKPSLTIRWLLVVLMLLFVPHLYYSYLYLDQSMCPDLLLRIIGSRLQEAGKGIYSYKWQPGDTTAWLNLYPDNREGLNGVTSTPLFLQMQQPLAKMKYCDIKLVWWIITEIFLFFTLWMSSSIFKTKGRQFRFLLIVSFFFLFDRNWLLHVYNGQVYVLYAFAFALVTIITLKAKRQRWNLLILALVSVLRPFFIVSAIAFWEFRWKHFLVLFAGVAVAGIIIFTTTDLSEWKQYNAAMQIHAREATDNIAMDDAYKRVDISKADPCIINSNASFLNFDAGCLFSIQHYLNLAGIKIDDVRFFQILLLAAVLLLWFIAYKKDWLQSIHHQLMLCFLFYQLCELITPASRNPYNMIQWLPVMAWLTAFANKKVIAITILGLCFNHNFPFYFDYQREIGEILMFSAAFIYLFQLKPSKLLSIRY